MTVKETIMAMLMPALLPRSHAHAPARYSFWSMPALQSWQDVAGDAASIKKANSLRKLLDNFRCDTGTDTRI